MIVGAPGVLLALLTLTLKDPPRGHSDQGSGAGDATPPISAVVKTLLSKPAVVCVLFGGSIGAAATYGMLTFVATFFVRRFDLNYAEAGLMAGLVTSVPMIFSNLGGGLLADWFARKDRRGYAWASVIGMVIAAPLFVAGFAQDSLTGVVILLVCAGVFQQSYLAPTYAVANNAVEPRMRATSVAVFSFSWNLVGLGFGPMIVGIFSDYFDRSLTASRAIDVFGLCGPGEGACADPSAVGLTYAMMGVAGCYAIGAVFYLLSARTMARDLAPVWGDKAVAVA
jgi:MFS family permease